MIDFDLSEAAELSGGTLTGKDVRISRVSTDSRDCRGALFIALRGEKFDGHDFTGQAEQNGAVALGVSRPCGGTLPRITCPDTLRLLGLCGLICRRCSRAKVLSLTGSCGKTTVKEFCASILARCGRTVATAGNFNNDVGVPLTLLCLERDTEFAVIEQGASHPGDIRRTCEFVQADVALINNAGTAHLSGFGSLEGVYLGKSEILDDVLSRGGMGIVPRESPWYERWQHDYASYFKAGKLFSFGRGPECLVSCGGEHMEEGKLCFELKIPEASFKVRLALPGLHNALNAAAACSLCILAGAPAEALRQGLESAAAIKGRLNFRDLGRLVLIDDTYNASFDAVTAALDLLKAQDGYKIMILGDMGELGADEQRLHAQVGEHARSCVDELLALGPLSVFSCTAAGSCAHHFDSAGELIKYATSLAAGRRCVFLVKGSHAMHMEKIGRALEDFAGVQV